MPLNSACCEEQHTYAPVLRWPCKPAVPRWKTKWAGSPVCHSEPDSKKWVDSSLPKLEMNKLFMCFLPSIILWLTQGTSVFGSARSEHALSFATLVLTSPLIPTERNRFLFALKATRSGQKTKSNNFPSKSSAQSNNETIF